MLTDYMYLPMICNYCRQIVHLLKNKISLSIKMFKVSLTYLFSGSIFLGNTESKHET